MSAQAPFFSSSWKAGRYLCELTVPPIEPGKPACCTIEWSPCMPDKPLTESEQRQYRQGLIAATAELHERLGGELVVMGL